MEATVFYNSYHGDIIVTYQDDSITGTKAFRADVHQSETTIDFSFYLIMKMLIENNCKIDFYENDKPYDDFYNVNKLYVDIPDNWRRKE